jgi:hypothetical protein
VSAVSRSLHASAGQDAPTDAALPLALLRAQHATRQPHQPPAPYPQALLPAGAPRVSGARYRARLRLPEPLAAPQSGATRPPCYPLAPFVRAPHVRYPAGLAQRIDAIKSAPPLPTAASVIAPQALLVQALVAPRRGTWQARAAVDPALAQWAQHHPDCPCVQALPASWSPLATSAHGLLPRQNGTNRPGSRR